MAHSVYELTLDYMIERLRTTDYILDLLLKLHLIPTMSPSFTNSSNIKPPRAILVVFLLAIICFSSRAACYIYQSVYAINLSVPRASAIQLDGKSSEINPTPHLYATRFENRRLVPSIEVTDNFGLQDDRGIVAQPYSSSNQSTIRFAVIGDYGMLSGKVKEVSELVKEWDPDFITTVGDNNYPEGSMFTIDHNVGRYYHRYILGYQGEYGAGAERQRFYTLLGNHDWDSIYCRESTCYGPYFEYFKMDGTQRYYSFQEGPVRFFMLDSDSREPDGISALSTQAMWLREQLALSDAVWNLVYLHHPPYSTGGERSHELLQWPYAEWGADVVLSGHSHVYERLTRDEMLFFVNGLGGKSRHQFHKDQPDWVQVRYNGNDGAMFVTADNESMNFWFYDRFDTLHDSHTIYPSAADEPTDEDNSGDDNEEPSPLRQSISIQLSHTFHDSSEDVATGMVEIAGNVLELGESFEEGETLVGLRFVDLQIPPDAMITAATIEFANQRGEDEDTNLAIRGEKACSAAPFSTQNYSLSQRPKTASEVLWTELPDWVLVGETRSTVDISEIVQEIVNYTGWKEGNAMAFYFQGSGNRWAVSYELQPELAPQLHIEYEIVASTQSDFPEDEEEAAVDSLFFPVIINDQCVLS